MAVRPNPSKLLVFCLLFPLGCAQFDGLLARLGAPPPPPAPEPKVETIEPAVYERAQAERNEFFEREVERLRADLREAEESIIALESGLRDPHTRADAVSAVAEARIGLERVRPHVPWRMDQVSEANAKLDEADAQLEAGHLGAAMFFASRASRITDTLRDEARQVALWEERRMIRAERVNLRAGPSLEAPIVRVLEQTTPVFPERLVAPWQLVRTPDGRVGWIHASLLIEP